MRSVLLACLAAVLALACFPSVSAAACAGARLTPSSGNLDRVRAATRCLINAERRRHGARPVRADNDLRQAAHRYAKRMVERNFFAHQSPSGSELAERVRASGYLRGARGWAAGENLAWGSGPLATPAATVRAWMGSPGHRANLLSARFREVGVGAAPGAPVQAVGGRAATYVTVYGSVQR
jgi:uncharacterized protein YkwD